MSTAGILMIMHDPVTCPMCEGAIPGNEIYTATTCPSCGADLSKLVRQRLAALRPAPEPPPQPPLFIAHAALFSLLAPCFSIAYMFGCRALSGSPVGMLAIGAVSLLVFAGGFTFGLVAFFAPKGEKAMVKTIAGIFINALLISFTMHSIFTSQKVAARGDNAPEPPRKKWSYLSGPGKN